MDNMVTIRNKRTGEIRRIPRDSIPGNNKNHSEQKPQKSFEREKLLDPLLRNAAEWLQNNPSFNKAIGTVANHPALQGAGALAGGAVQGAADIGASTLNAPASFSNHFFNTDLPKIPHPEIRKKFNPGLVNDVAFLGGEIGGSFGPGGALFKALGKIPGVGKASGLTGDVVKGITTGLVAGPEEHRQLAGAFGGLAAPLTRLPSITDKGLGNKIVEGFKSAKKESNKEFGEVFRAAKNAGADKLESSITPEMHRILSEVSYSPKQKRLLDKYIANPTVKTGHDIQSSLGKIVDKLTKKAEISGLDHLEREALKAAKEAQEKIKFDIVRELTNRGGIDLPFKYLGALENYGKKVGPYLDVKAIRKAAMNPKAKGAIDPATVPQTLRGNEGYPFRNSLGHEYPEMKANDFINSPLFGHILKVGAQGAGYGAAGAVGWDLLKNKFGR